jgi:hypothetical protein
MTSFQRFILSDKTKDDRSKQLWFFPDNPALVDSFVIGSKLEKVLIKWGDDTSDLVSNFQPVDHIYN